MRRFDESQLKIHIESGNIYDNNTDTNESIHSFFKAQDDETKKWIDFEFILSDDYNDYFMKHLTNIKDGEDEKYDMLANKNSYSNKNFYSTISMTT